MFNSTLNRFQFDLNTSGGLRFIDTCNRFQRDKAYIAEERAKNEASLSRTLNGFSDMSNLVYLQIRGKSKLQKEIEEIEPLETKFL